MSGEVVSCSDKSQPSLQEAFARFRKARKDELQRAIAKESEGRHRSDAEVDALRAKFLEQALSYQGIPYAQRYHEPGSKFHDAPLFLDCCGLVRRVLRDLKEDFGFDIGRWNQAYQFDTLPIAIDDPKDMKPGDLVFISGDYFHKDKQQIHRMTHVEIWMGDGEKTLGARWQRGVVEIHDSYKFVSKSYGNMEYHFRSIDTWLQGVCVSHCPEHKWQTVRAYRPTKNSIFSLDDADESICDDDDDADEGAGDDDDDDVDDMPDQDDQENQVPCDSAKGTPAVRTVPDDSKKGTGAGTVKLPPIGRTPTSGRTPAAGRTPAGGRTPGAGSSKASTASGGPRSGRGAIARASSTPQYFVGGHNGDSIINEHLAERGWTRVTDAKDTKFFFKWVELKRDIVYDSFRPGVKGANFDLSSGVVTQLLGRQANHQPQSQNLVFDDQNQSSGLTSRCRAYGQAHPAHERVCSGNIQGRRSARAPRVFQGGRYISRLDLQAHWHESGQGHFPDRQCGRIQRLA
eukprot:m.227490 g.227490  ORF g.227490 m.227490 type:complete len:515 (-) comp10851_c3_seq3:732-2276(-)